MGHSHEGHCHHHSVSSLENINRAFYIGIGLNLLYTIIEFAVGFKINSLALISDASLYLGFAHQCYSAGVHCL